MNLGGFSKEGYDEFQQWAHSPKVVEHAHIIFLQETWRPSSEFSSDSWHWIQSGTKKAQHQGVAILLSKRLAAARCVRFAEVVKGRILKVHLPAEPGNHLRRRPITLICVYQHARVSEQAVVYEKREKIWEQVNRALASVPWRHTLLVAGDWNTPLLEDGSFVGSGVLQSKWLPSDHAQFAGILQAHGLCALNTWGPVSSAATFVSPGAKCSTQDEGVATQIDFLLGRRGQASTTGRAAMPVPHIHFSSWRTGTRHLPLATIITDSRAEWKPSTKQTSSGPSRDLMTNVLSQSSEARQAFQDRVEQAVESLSVSTVMPNEVDAALTQVSLDMFGGLAPECAPKPWQTSEVQITLKQVWAGRTELCKVQSRLLSGENVHGVLAVWKKWAQFQKLRKQLRKASAEKRRQRWDTQLQEAEQALEKGDAHAFYSAIKRMAPRVERGRVQLRSKTGDVLTVEEEMEALYLHWRKVFDVRSLPAQDWLLRPMDISLDEVHAAIQALAARKASMPGTAPGVAWKFGGPRIAELMWGILQREWGAGKLQHDSFLTRSWLHFFEKPGRTLRDPSDLRPIALQPVASKVFSALIRNKLKPYLGQIILRYPQYAYVEGGELLRPSAELLSTAPGFVMWCEARSRICTPSSRASRKQPAQGAASSA